MKTYMRMSVWAIAALAVVVLTTGCPDKLRNLKAKADEAERELNGIHREKADLQAKIDRVAGYAREVPPNNTAIIAIQPEIHSEQAFLDALRQKLLPKLDEIHKEMTNLNAVEWSDAFNYMTNYLPLLTGVIASKAVGLVSAEHDLDYGARQKVEQLSNLVMQQVALVDSLSTLPPGSEQQAALQQLDSLLAQASSLSFGPEIELAGWMAEQLEFVGPLPVMAGSFVPHVAFDIEEGLPSTLAHLNDGVLAPGTEIMLQLPPKWMITAPITVASPNLVLEVQGNVPGTNAVKIRVLGELEPGMTNDTITVTFHGIYIGPDTGIMSSSMFVYPGRASKLDFCVIQDPPPLFDAPHLTPSGMALSWVGRGTLKTALQAEGPYINAPSQANPQMVPVINPAQYFRVSRP